MKKILIATPYMHTGGVEVSLIRFLKEISVNNDITLLLLKKEGIYLKDIPKNVKIVTVNYDNSLYDYDNKIADVINFHGFDKVKYLIFRIKLKLCLMFNNWDKYYKLILPHIKDLEDNYDLAIDFHGYGHIVTSIVAEKVEAKKKAFFVHDEKCEWITKIKSWINDYNRIYCVSKACRQTLIKDFPFLFDKADVFYNIIDYKEIRERALEKIDTFSSDVINLVTVGRLEWQKGYDILLLVAKRLKERNFKFNWFVIGDGTLKTDLEKMKVKYGLNNVIFLGIKKNPFPYIKNADFYIQTSRHEGFGLAIMEAKILGTVVIATDLNCVKEQITNNENGFLCELNPTRFADKIIEISKNKELIKKIKENLSDENFDYTSQFEKLYKLMEE